MAIERLNPDGLHATPGYHHVTIVDAGRTAYLAGLCPLDADGNVVGTTPDEAGLATQVDQVAANALIALAAAGRRHPQRHLCRQRRRSGAGQRTYKVANT